MLVWPDVARGRGWFGRRIRKKNGRQVPQHSEPPVEEAQVQSHPRVPPTGMQSKEPTHIRAAGLLGLALVARGEIALIVAELARPILLDGNNVEPFAVVIWAILLSTIGGALGVGLLLRLWK